MLSLPCLAGAWPGTAPSRPLDGSAFVSLLRRSRFVPFPSLLPPLLLPFRFPSRPPPWRGGSPRVSPRGQRIGGRGIIALVKQSGLCHIPRGKRMISLPVIFFFFLLLSSSQLRSLSMMGRSDLIWAEPCSDDGACEGVGSPSTPPARLPSRASLGFARLSY